MARSALKLALQAEKGTDIKKIKEKRRHKERVQRRKEQGVTNGGAATATKTGGDADEEWEDEDDEKLQHGGAGDSEELDQGSEGDEEDEGDSDAEIDYEALNDSDTSGSSVELEKKIVRQPKAKQSSAAKPDTKSKKALAPPPSADDDEDDDDDEDEDDEQDPISMSDLEDLPEDEKDDLIPFQRLRINNTSALLASLARIAIPTDASVPFATHQSVTSSKATAEAVPDVYDDVARELALYAQSLEAARVGRTKLRAEKVPFSRPTDYFAEMVKSDEHVDKIRTKLMEEATNKKAAAEARKLRDLKKFGKQVQVAKLQERAKSKKDTLEKIKSLKRKRQESSGDLDTREGDLFDVAVDNEIKKHGSSKTGAGGARRAGAGGAGDRQANAKRQRKNERYGSGGRKRFAKSGDAMSSGDLSGFNAGRRGTPRAGGRGGKAPRPGKNRRQAAEARR